MNEITSERHQFGSLGWAKRQLKQAVNLTDAMRRRLYGPVTGVQIERKAAALTFDDGPNPVYTPRLLKVLQRHGAKATFFMLGKAAERYPELVDAVAEAGHAIGNHSYSHCDFREISRRRRREEILACSKSLRGHESKIFRPPYGRENFACHFDARSLGYAVVKWTISTGDWNELPGVEIADRIMRPLKPGMIILLHDSIATNPNADRSSTIEAVERILEITAGNYNYLTIPDIFKHGCPRTGSHILQ